MSEARHCRHCDPYVQDPQHIIERIDMVLAPLSEILSAFEAYLRRLLHIPDALFLKALLALGVLRLAEARDDDGSLYNRSLVVVREARKRGIEIRAVTFRGRGIDVYSLDRHGRRLFFRALPHLVIDGLSPEVLDNKAELKKLLKARSLPHPRGELCTNYRRALQFVHSGIGFPVVIKPDSQSLSLHVTTNIRDEAKLQEAIAIAKQISRRFVVEEHIEGDVFRITVLNGEVVAACRREPPHIMGNGARSVRELIDSKNRDPERGAPHQKNRTLHRIVVSERALSVLASQGIDIDSIPESGKKVYLHDKLVLACGADIADVTDTMHPANKELFATVGKLCRLSLVGIDFLAPDISKPHHEQKCGILEVNSVPYIDMHHYPTNGTPRNVAGLLLDHCLTRTPFADPA